MSRAFVKETDGTEDLPDRPVSPGPNPVTARGLALIEGEMARLRTALAQAQTAGDRGGVAQASRDLRYWAARRGSARLAPPADDAETVRFGLRVTVERDGGRRQSFRIVGEDEADPARGLLSHAAPLARALQGRRVGDVVRVGAGEAEIVAIEAVPDDDPGRD